jgi:hypothetical protein
MSYNIRLANIMHVLTTSRQLAPHDVKTTKSAIRLALYKERGEGVHYTLESALRAVEAADITLTEAETDALTAIDSEVQENV